MQGKAKYRGQNFLWKDWSSNMYNLSTGASTRGLLSWV